MPRISSESLISIRSRVHWVEQFLHIGGTFGGAVNRGEKLRDREIDAMIKAVDTDGDGMENFEEFVKLLE